MTDTGTDLETDTTTTEVKKPAKEVAVVRDQGFFEHETGDTYEGSFEAKKKDRSLKMFGPGVYTTAEGDSYAGTWEADRLGANEMVTIRYHAGAKYEGPFKDWSYAGKGRYHYPDESILSGEFVENIPVGNLVLTDPNEHIWLGKAAQGYGWFEPVNHYYDMLEKTRDAGKDKKKRKTSESKLTRSKEKDSPSKVKDPSSKLKDPSSKVKISSSKVKMSPTKTKDSPKAK